MPRRREQDVVRTTAERIAVLGDLHLGRPGSSLACAVPADEIGAAASALAATHDLVVINGDLFDLERGATPSQRRELALLDPIHQDATRALSGPRFVWTRGNHDRVLGRSGRAHAAVEVTTASGTIRVEHGDRFDPPIKRWPAFTSLVTWASGRARTTPALEPAYRAMRFLERTLSGHGEDADDPVAVGARDWLADSEHVALVIGHTHGRAVLRTADGRATINPGHSMDRLRVCSIDASAGTFVFAEWAAGSCAEVGSRRPLVAADDPKPG